METYELKQMLKESKLTIHCADCKMLWMVGDRERTEEEKKEWLCPNCISRIRAEEAKVDEMEQGTDKEKSDSCREFPY